MARALHAASKFKSLLHYSHHSRASPPLPYERECVVVVVVVVVVGAVSYRISQVQEGGARADPVAPLAVHLPPKRTQAGRLKLGNQCT